MTGQLLQSSFTGHLLTSVVVVFGVQTMAEAEYETGYAADFFPPLEKKHECPVCIYALRDPIQTACGHRFCTSCIKQILK